MNARILLVEDDAALAQMLSFHFEDQEHEVIHALTLSIAEQLLHSHQPDLIILDQSLPDGKGYDFLCQTISSGIKTTIIMMTAEHDLELAITAIKSGAFDFIHKPIKPEALDITVKRALDHQRLSRQVKALSTLTETSADQPRLLGQSEVMLNISKEIALIAESKARVLITGESGTGKELVARAIHHHSQRLGPFLAINCAALVDNLLESELFGHERGAFTGATQRKAGKFELAENGTLFLDEIGEMAQPLQAKLLRVLQEGTFERLGGTQQIRSNARVISATNRNLSDEIKKGLFREDLFYRLNTLHIHLPPLRERNEDIPLICKGLIQRICRNEGKPSIQLTQTALHHLQHYSWPGNIRELENVLTQAVIRLRGNIIEHTQLNISNPQQSVAMDNNIVKLKSLAEMEAEHISKVLRFCNGHKGNSCKTLGISRPALDRKIVRYDIDLS
ncbi:MAG: sigma-54-dependent Fis family transcriptional regulator [Methylococcales bacterium]|nr:sigma-54-dependent Fis family transcriptional regulator [Methylococcales bacterium]